MLRDSIRVLRALRALDDVLFAEIQFGGCWSSAANCRRSGRPPRARPRRGGSARTGRLRVRGGDVPCLWPVGARARSTTRSATLDEAVRTSAPSTRCIRSTLAPSAGGGVAGSSRRPTRPKRRSPRDWRSASEQGLSTRRRCCCSTRVELDHAVGRRARPATMDAIRRSSDATERRSRGLLCDAGWDVGFAAAASLASRRDNHASPRRSPTSTTRCASSTGWSRPRPSSTSSCSPATTSTSVRVVECDAQIVGRARVLRAARQPDRVVVSSGNHDLTGSDANGERPRCGSTGAGLRASTSTAIRCVSATR